MSALFQKTVSDRQLLIDIIEQKLLTPVFQPIFNIQTSQLMGYEALIRGPKHSRLHRPADLFRVANCEGMLAELEYACRSVSMRHFFAKQGREKLFINFSPMSLKQGYKKGVTSRLLDRLGVAPENIVIEISEQYELDDYPLIKQATAHYRQIGCEIAIDDLGAGYAGLRAWEEIRPDYVKVDRHFIDGIDIDKTKQAFVQSIAQIADGLDCKVIAEGIETVEQLNTVKQIGLVAGQGFFLGRPSRNFITVLPDINNHQTTTSPIKQCASMKNSSKPLTVRDFTEAAVSIEPTDNFTDIVDLFRGKKNLDYLPVVDQQRPVGAISRRMILDMLFYPFGSELNAKKTALQLMNPQPVVITIDDQLDDVNYQLAQLKEDDELSHFIVVENGCYRGLCKIQALLSKLAAQQLEAAKYANPLTQLPGNLVIDKTLKQWVQAKHEFAVAYFDLNNFKPFNDHYGYKAGDDVIVLLADIIRQHCDRNKDFIGHIGGDDFVVFFKSNDYKAICTEIINSFDNLVVDFYDQKAIAEGGITGRNRQGAPCFFALLGLAVGVVKPDIEQISNYHDISVMASEAKHQAKQFASSNLYLCRRQQRSSLATPALSD